MKKIKITKKIIEQIRNNKIKLSVGQDIKKTQPTLNGGNITSDDLANYLDKKPEVVLALSSNRYFLVSPARYNKLKGTPPEKGTAIKHQIDPKEMEAHHISVVSKLKEVSLEEAKQLVQPIPTNTFSIPKVITMWDKVAEFIELFPSLEVPFREAMNIVSTSSCSGCAANKLKNGLITKMITLYKEADGMVMPDDLKKYVDPQFSLGLAQSMVLNKLPDGTIAPGGTVLMPTIHNHQSPGYRPTCLDCVRKHIGQATVLLQESEQPEYKQHFWLGMGHLAEAESESLSTYPVLANKLRGYRLAMMANRDYKPEMLNLFEVIDDIEVVNE